MATTFTFRPYKSGVFRTINRSLDYIGATIKVALLNSTYTPDTLAHTSWADVVAHEISGQADYAAQTLGGKSISYDSVTGRTALKAATVSFGTSVTISARYVALYADIAGANTGKFLFGYIDLNEGGSTNVSSLNQVFEIAFNADGIYLIAP